jgi:hypothetical protein
VNALKTWRSVEGKKTNNFILSVIMKQATNSPYLLILDMKIFLAWGIV